MTCYYLNEPDHVCNKCGKIHNGDLPSQIMNMPAGDIGDANLQAAYLKGHQAARHAAAELVSAELARQPAPAAKRLIGWRTDDYLNETADKKMADNWSAHYALLPIFEGDPHTKLAVLTEASPAA